MGEQTGSKSAAFINDVNLLQQESEALSYIENKIDHLSKLCMNLMVCMHTMHTNFIS